MRTGSPALHDQIRPYFRYHDLHDLRQVLQLLLVNVVVPSRRHERELQRALELKDQFTKLKNLLVKHPSIFVVNVDNVGSKQMHQIRVALRGKGIVVLGKNTMVRRALRSILAEFPQFERLLPHVKVSSSHQATSRRSMYYTANRKKHSPTTLDRFQARLVFSEHGA
ncbi:hypothetical protein EVJ58_g2388 [Rhodofomes roseus]|uniref:Ribosomal protein L10 n=1 Tax=Rhodofomes roseus TaxID=34475 RepID=A0A4Y9YTA2_9APHY|nr:hypothetical protein EVJ58_g2388 [Rhodofomes roseus]